MPSSGGDRGDAGRAAGLIAAFLVLRLAAAAWVGLGIDESYSLAIARRLQLSYFDHPPLHQWIIHFSSPILGYGRAARLPFVFLFAGSSWLLFALTRRLFGGRAGLWAVLSINLAAFFTVAAGAWVLPDGPLIFCLLAAALALAKLLFDAPGTTTGWSMVSRWMVVGFWTGLAGLAKYHAVLFAIGVAIVVITSRRHRSHLRQPGPYLAALVAAAMISPVILWNAQHQWASFVFQGGRGLAHHGVRPAAVAVALLGQAMLLLPWIVAPIGLAVASSGRRVRTDPGLLFCLALGLPTIVFFAVTPLWGKPSLPHWAMPGWIFLFPVLGRFMAEAAQKRAWPRVWACGSLAALALVWTVLVTDSATGWIGAAWPRLFSKGDPTVETVEWSPLVHDLAARPSFHEPRLFIATLKWTDAGKVAQALDGRMPVVVLSDDPRGFGYGPTIPDLAGRDAMIIAKPAELARNLPKINGCFKGLRSLDVHGFGRRGREEIRVVVLLGRSFSGACARAVNKAAS